MAVARSVRSILRRLRERARARHFERYLDTFRSQEYVSVVQIGAFTGNTENDPLFAFLKQNLSDRPLWRVIIVEPIAKHFEDLKAAYHGMRVTLLQCAVAESPGYREMLTLGEVDPEDHGFPSWLHQLSSLDEDRMGSRWENYEGDAPTAAFFLRHARRERVWCTTVAEILATHGVSRLDLLQIDTEGYDAVIVGSIDLNSVAVRAINYERVLLRTDEEREIRSNLTQQGYKLRDWGQDTFAVRR